jgi:hypothetical protein
VAVTVLVVGAGLADQVLAVTVAALALITGLAMTVFPALAVAVLVGVTYANLPAVAAETYGVTVVGEILVPAMLGIVALRCLARGELARDLPKLALLFAAYVASIAVSAFYAHDVPHMVAELVTTVKNAIIALAVIGLVSDFERFRVATVTLVATAAVLAAFSVLQYATGAFHHDFGGLANATLQNIAGEEDSWRLSGPLTDANFYAMVLLPAVPIAVDRMVHARAWWSRTAAAAAAAAVAVAIVLTYSRGALVALAVMAAVAGWSLRRRLLPVAVLAVAVVIAATQILSAQYLARVTQAIDDVRTTLAGSAYVEDPAVAGRLSEMLAAIHMFADHPLFGVGFGQAEIRYQDTAMIEGLMARGSDRQAHSLYLEVLAERGLVGAAVFGGLLLFAWLSTVAAARALDRAGARADAQLARAYGIGLIGFLVASTFLHDGYPRYFWLILALALALPQAAAAQLRKDR